MHTNPILVKPSIEANAITAKVLICFGRNTDRVYYTSAKTPRQSSSSTYKVKLGSITVGVILHRSSSGQLQQIIFMVPHMEEVFNYGSSEDHAIQAAILDKIINTAFSTVLRLEHNLHKSYSAALLPEIIHVTMTDTLKTTPTELDARARVLGVSAAKYLSDILTLFTKQ